jgi:hypothetical protein
LRRSDASARGDHCLGRHLDGVGERNRRSIVGNFLSLVASALVTGVFAVAFQRVTAHSNKGTYDVFD